MHTLIKNRDRLVAHGFTAGREKAIDIVTYALQGVNARQAVKNKVHLVDGVLKIEDQSFDLRNFRNIYAIGDGSSIREAIDTRTKEETGCQKRPSRQTALFAGTNPRGRASTVEDLSRVRNSGVGTKRTTIPVDRGCRGVQRFSVRIWFPRP